MADVFDLVAKIRLDSSEYESGVGKAKGTMSSLASGVGKGLATVAKIGGAAVSAAATGVAALTKMGVEGYAQYEQLTGGIETLFKASGDAVMAYAENAYKTSGLSANAYMETVTSFSASLIQSLDGDTAKAAEVADMAITDMSDNANKMGTSIEMIQNAYNGFAKGNFTMLDNLKLGYGGTAEEMKRLLADAEKISGIKYDISSFADISEAIHVMQQEMGIAGATAAEASSTIEGSLAMMKASWENLVVGMADENADMDALMGNFVESVATAAENLIPRIEQTLMGIGSLVERMAPVIAEALPSLISNVLPSLLNAATTLLETVSAQLPGIINSTLPTLIEVLLGTVLPMLIETALSLVMSVIGVITDNADQFLQAGIDAVIQIINGITESLPDIIAAAISIITSLFTTLTSEENLNLMLDSAIALLEAIVNGLIENLPKLVDAAIQLVMNLANFITEPGNLEKLLTTAVTMITTIINGLVGAIPGLVDAAIQLVTQLVEFLLKPENIEMLLSAALDIVLAIVEGLLAAAGELVVGAVELIDSLTTEFEETDWKEVGKTIINTLLEGLKEAWTSVSSWFSGVWDALFNRNVNVSADENGNVSVSGGGKGHATGLDYVPYDEYPAILHRGEAVLTAAEARAWRKYGIGGAPVAAGGITINQYIQTVPQTPVELANATESYFEQARWML